jgi:serine/threonine protein kinase
VCYCFYFSALYDRRVHVGANRMSDIWSLGCLLYELVTGDYLFLENNEAMFYMRITNSKESLISPEQKRRLDDTKEPRLLGILEYILTRNPIVRPSLQEIKFRVLYLLAVRHKERHDKEKGGLI